MPKKQVSKTTPNIECSMCHVSKPSTQMVCTTTATGRICYCRACNRLLDHSGRRMVTL